MIKLLVLIYCLAVNDQLVIIGIVFAGEIDDLY